MPLWSPRTRKGRFVLGRCGEEGRPPFHQIPRPVQRLHIEIRLALWINKPPWRHIMANELWFPLYEWQDWFYQSFLALTSEPEESISFKPWAKGQFACGQALRDGDNYTLSGSLNFSSGITLAVTSRGKCGSGIQPATFEATGISSEGPAKGAAYELFGWAFPKLPIESGAAPVLKVQGSVKAVQGPDARPELDLSGMPIGTVGTFIIISRGPRG